jgi:uncharacterized membrane protein
MSQSIENYVSRELAGYFRKQAFRVWAAALIVVLVWVFLILLAPLTAGRGLDGVSQPVYQFFSFVCHQMESRSFHLVDHPFAVCTRCFGVYFGLLFGFAAYPLFRRIEEIEPLPRYWLFLAMIPIGVDWLLGVFGIWENTHLSRFVTGLILGAACAIFIVPALVEIARLVSKKSRRAASRPPSSN